MSSNDDGGSKLGRNPRTPGDYEVGYGRPPRAHRFKKGEPSRNPKGRPRGTNRPAPDLVAALWQPVTIRMQGRSARGSTDFMLKFPRPDEGGGSNLARFPRMAGNSL